MKKSCVCLLVGLFCFTLNAQKRIDPTPEHISQAKKLKNSHEDEEIVILSKSVVISFDINKKSGEVEVLKGEHIEFMNIASSSRMQYPVFYDSESEVKKLHVSSRQGRNLSKYFTVKDEHLKSNEFFHTDYRVQYVNLSFPLQGSIFQVETEKLYKDIKYFTSEYIAQPYHTLEGKITINIPEWLDLEIMEFNFEGYTISKIITTDSGGKLVTYEFKNVAAQSKESSKPGPSHLYPHILFLAKSFQHNNEIKLLFSDVKDLYSWYNGLVENVVVDTSVFMDKVKELTDNASDDEEKVRNIFYWVQDNIRYIAFEDGIAGFQPDSPQNVYTKRYGDCKGMAILTKSMLEVAGFDSKLVWIGTDRLAYDYSIPSLSVDNHMICAVNLNGETIFLDGTEKYNRFGEYASRIQNKQALLQDDSGFKILTVPQAENDSNLDKISYELKIEDGTISGTANRFYSAECRVAFQNNYSSLGRGNQQEVLSKYLTSGNSNYTVKSIHPFDEEERDKDLNISYEVNIEKAISEFDGTLYIDIDPVKFNSDYIFDKRKSDYNSSFKQKKVTAISLEIPAGYSVEMFPENLSLSNDFVDIMVTYEQAGNKIVYIKDIHFKKRHIKKEQFPEWNESFTQLRNNLNQQITLVKN